MYWQNWNLRIEERFFYFVAQRVNKRPLFALQSFALDSFILRCSQQCQSHAHTHTRTHLADAYISLRPSTAVSSTEKRARSLPMPVVCSTVTHLSVLLVPQLRRLGAWRTHTEQVGAQGMRNERAHWETKSNASSSITTALRNNQLEQQSRLRHVTRCVRPQNYTTIVH